MLAIDKLQIHKAAILKDKVIPLSHNPPRWLSFPDKLSLSSHISQQGIHDCVKMNPSIIKRNYWQFQLKTMVILEYVLNITEKNDLICAVLDIALLSQRMYILLRVWVKSICKYVHCWTIMHTCNTVHISINNFIFKHISAKNVT